LGSGLRSGDLDLVPFFDSFDRFGGGGLRGELDGDGVGLESLARLLFWRRVPYMAVLTLIDRSVDVLGKL
jgi:hypothetical protein